MMDLFEANSRAPRHKQCPISTWAIEPGSPRPPWRQRAPRDWTPWSGTSPQRDAVGNLGNARGGVAAKLLKDGETVVDGVRIVLTTRQGRDPAGAFKLPLAARWPGDEGILALDSTHRPALLALVGSPWRLRIWLTAFDLEVPEADGEEGPVLFADHDPGPVVVSEQLQRIVQSHSGVMTLSSNGIHDSHGPEFLKAVRLLIRSGQATPEAVAVAALQAGWWPEKIPALLKKLRPR